MFSFSKGGADIDSLKTATYTKNTVTQSKLTDWSLIQDIFATAQYVYVRLTVVAVLLLAIFTIFLIKPVSLTINPTHSWIAWVVVMVGFFLVLRGNVFSAYVQGMNQITLFRRWDAVTGLLAIASNTAVLLFDGTLLGLIISHQFWLIIGVPRKWLLSRY